MKFIRALIGCILFFSSCRTISRERIATRNSQYIGFENDTIESPLLKFDTIGAFEYAACKKAYHEKIDRNYKRHLLRTDTSFYVLTKDSAYFFPSDTNDYNKFAYYDGYYHALKLHAVTFIDGHNETGYSFLIDDKRSLLWMIPSAFDDPCNPPDFSIDHRFLAAYANDSYRDNGSSIALIHVNDKSPGKKFELLYFFVTDQWKIKELVWMKDNSFALDVITVTVNEETGVRTEIENFLMADFD